MKWYFKILCILFLSVPAFTGYPLGLLDRPVIPGISCGWLVYLTVVMGFILLFLGSQALANAVGIASLITVPVVFFGSGISYLLFLFQIGGGQSQAAFSIHYVSLCITMLTVIPLALSMVATIPFHQVEQHLLQNGRGISRLEKFLLMLLRVFNHVFYFVIPEIREVIREENFFRLQKNAPLQSSPKSDIPSFTNSIFVQIKTLLSRMIHVGVEGICASIRFIPIWAVEIARLPEKRKGIKNERNDTG